MTEFFNTSYVYNKQHVILLEARSIKNIKIFLTICLLNGQQGMMLMYAPKLIFNEIKISKYKANNTIEYKH